MNDGNERKRGKEEKLSVRTEGERRKEKVKEREEGILEGKEKHREKRGETE